MCNEFMSVARARCPDCREILIVPYDWCAQEFTAPALVADMLAAHARLMPVLHPTVLGDAHLTTPRMPTT